MLLVCESARKYTFKRIIQTNPPVFRDTCSWKGQLEKTRIWKVLSWKVRHEIKKNEVEKFGLKLESFG